MQFMNARPRRQSKWASAQVGIGLAGALAATSLLLLSAAAFSIWALLSRD